MVSGETASRILHIPSSIKNLPSTWKWRRLDAICQAIVDCPHSTPKITSDGPFMVRTQDILSGMFRTENAAHVSEETYYERTRRAEPAFGDLLYSREGTYFGIAAEVPTNVHVCLGQRMVLIKPDPNQIHFRFLRYWLNSSLLTAHVFGQRDGTVAERLNLPTICGLPIPVLPLPEQHAIAHILGTLDDKIELNHQMNKALEAIAQALFKSWFVDFDPVRARMEGRQPYGMDAEMAALFPDSFEDSVLGEIPKGWINKPLDQIADFLNGLALQNYPPTGNDYLPVIKIAELRRGITESSGQASPQIEKKYIVEDGDILFSWSGSLEVCVWCGGRGALNQHLFKVTSIEYPKWFYYHWIKYHLPEFQAIAAGKATTMGHIQRHHLREAYTLVPPDNTMRKLDQIMSPILDRVISNNIENRILMMLRDLLLPKLLSGEIRVKDAEKFMEANSQSV